MEAFDPWIEAEQDWSGWRIRLASLHGIGEVWDTRKRVILTDPAEAGEIRAVAHVIAHLRLGHHLRVTDGRFSDDQEDQADTLTDVLTLRDLSDLIVPSRRDDG